MELFLLGGVAVGAFIVAGGAALLWTTRARAHALETALKDALARNAHLEAALGGAAPPYAAAAPAEPLIEPPDTALHHPGGAQTALIHTLVAALAAGAAIVALWAARLGQFSGAGGFIVALLAGLAALLVAQLVRDRHTPTRALTAFGLTLIGAVSWYSATFLGAPAPLAGYFIVSCAALTAIGASHRLGRALLTLGAAGALAAPALFALGADGLSVHFPVLLAMTILAIWRGEALNAPTISIAASLGAAMWGFASAALYDGPFAVALVSAFAAALGAIGAAVAWPAARAERPWLALREGRGLRLAHGGALMLVSGGLIAFALLRAEEAAPIAAGALVLVASGAAFAALRAEGLAPIALTLAFGALITLGGWPAPARIEAFAASAALLATLLSVAGWIGMARARDARTGAALTALAPGLALLVAQTRLGDAGGAWLWAGGSVLLAALNGLFYARARDLRAKPEATAAFAAGAAICLALAVYFLAPPWAGAGVLGLCALALAGADARVNEPGVRLAACAVGAGVLARLIGDAAAPVQTWLGAPWLAMLSVQALAGGGALLGAGWAFARRGARVRTFAARACFGAGAAALLGGAGFALWRAGAQFGAGAAVIAALALVTGCAIAGFVALRLYKGGVRINLPSRAMIDPNLIPPR